MSGWQPIETAPISRDPFLEDVQPCLVYGKRIGVKIGRAFRYPDLSVFADAAGFHGDWGITHWQPLPEPPQ